MDRVQLVLVTVLAGLLVILAVSYYTSRLSGASGVSSERRRPTFFLVGPTNSGKTALFYHLSEAQHLDDDNVKNITPTVSSIEPNFTTIKLPMSNLSVAKNYQLIDFPGHLKYNQLLFQLIIDQVTLSKTRGIIYVIDSSSSPSDLKEISKSLFRLLALTERKTGGVDVLFALNKKDLFNSRPAFKIREILEKEITQLIKETLSEKFSAQTGIEEEEEDLQDLTSLKEFWSSVIGTQDRFKFEILDGNMDFISGSILKNQVDAWENWLDEKVVNI